MKTWGRNLTLTALAALGLNLHLAQAVTLVEEGVAKAAIVIDANPTRSARLGALELQSHLRQMTGAELPILTDGEPLPEGAIPILVGESASTRVLGHTSHRFKPQESLVSIGEEAIVLIGRDDLDYGDVDYEKLGTWQGFAIYNPFYRVGSLYAVYDFLETECGVRWYMVSDLGTVVPRRPTLTVEAVERQQAPWTRYRVVGSGGWGRPGDPGEIDMAGVNRYKQWSSPRDTSLFVLRSRKACEPYNVNHSVTDYFKRFGETHPDWFVRGKPGPDVQPRFDHPEVIAQVAADAVEYFKLPFSARRRGADIHSAARISAGDYFAMYPLDNRDYGDDLQPPAQPERSGDGFGNGVYSDYIFAWVKAVAENLLGVYPDAYVSTIAYAGTFEPPTFAMPSNVAVTVAMADGWAADGYGMKVLHEWRRKVSQLYTWEYHYARGYPAIRPHRITPYIDTLRAMGVDGMFMEIGDTNPIVSHLDYYITMKALCEPELDAEAVIEEYCRLFYGPAEAPMRTFWQLIEEGYEEVSDKQLGPSHQWAIGASETRLAKIQAALAQAEQVATEDPYSSRLAAIRSGMFERLVEQGAFHAKVVSTPLPHLEIPRVAAAAIKVDGILDEPVWQQAAATPPFVTMLNETPAVATSAKLAWDERNLYIAFICEEPNMGELRQEYTDSTSMICVDDSLEVNLDMDPESPDYVQIMLNVNSATWTWWRKKYSPQTSPELGVQGVVHRLENGWSGEIVVPFAVILAGQSPKPGDTWGLNVMRNRYAFSTKKRFDPEHWHCWSPPYSWSWHIKDRFGRVTFGGER